MAVLGGGGAPVPDRGARAVAAHHLQSVTGAGEDHDRVVGADQAAGLLGDHGDRPVGILLGRSEANQLGQGFSLPAAALRLCVEAGGLQGRPDLGCQQGQELDLFPAVAAVVLGGDAEGAQRLLARHHRHAHGRLDALVDRPGHGLAGVAVVFDEDRLPPLERLPEGALASRDPLALAIARRLAGQQPQRLRGGVPPAQRGALGLQQLAGAVNDQPAQLAEVAEAAGGDRDLVQGAEVVRLLDRFLRQACGLQRGCDLRREEHQQLLVVVVPLPAAAAEDTDRADRAVRDHQRHRQPALDAAVD